MCLLFIAYKQNPGYRLIAAANRDEFLNRQTAPLGYLDMNKTQLGGRDLQAGGTWLAVSSKQKFGAITNFRGPSAQRTNVPSRGEIITDFLSRDVSAGQFLCQLRDRGNEYNGFNLILGDAQELYYYSNMLDQIQLLVPGFYGLSNHALDTPWPKLLRGKNALYAPMVETKQIAPLDIFSVLADRWQPPDDELPDTGVGLEWERILGPIFIDSELYGTRTSAIITFSNEGLISFYEKTIPRTRSQHTDNGYVHLSMQSSP